MEAVAEARQAWVEAAERALPAEAPPAAPPPRPTSMRPQRLLAQAMPLRPRAAPGRLAPTPAPSSKRARTFIGMARRTVDANRTPRACPMPGRTAGGELPVRPATPRREATTTATGNRIPLAIQTPRRTRAPWTAIEPAPRGVAWCPRARAADGRMRSQSTASAAGSIVQLEFGKPGAGERERRGGRRCRWQCRH